jgi:hypothetical protein
VDESGVSPVCHSTITLHAHISPGGRTIGQLAVAVQRRSLTLSTWTAYMNKFIIGVDPQDKIWVAIISIF